MKTFSLHGLLLLACGIPVLGFLPMPAFAQETGKMQELQRVINAQQNQLEEQQNQLEEQKKQLDAQRQLLHDLQMQIDSLAKGAGTEEAPVVAEKPAEKPEVAFAKAPAPVEKIVTSGQERVKISISGHVNRALNVVDDGKKTEVYHVDNGNSVSRIRFIGIAKATEDLTLGSQIELSIAPNKAGDLNQNNKETNNVFDQRITELTLDSKRYGKLSMGKGNTASYGSTTVDLSRTGIIAYSTIADTAGGMLFRQKGDDSLTDVRISDAFNDFNGLSRKSRLRYDTPSFNGFHLSGALISDERSDAALRWGWQGYGFKAAGAAGIADLNEEATDLQYSGSFSLLHENTGLNLTLSGGLQERDNQDDAKNYYAKAGWLTSFFDVGKTAFGVDYTRSLNLPTDNDDGYSVGAAAVQFFEEYGTEIYLLYRVHSLDRDVEPSVQDINVVSSGARVKF